MLNVADASLNFRPMRDDKALNWRAMTYGVPHSCEADGAALGVGI